MAGTLLTSSDSGSYAIPRPSETERRSMVPIASGALRRLSTYINPCSADAEMTGERRPALELAAIEQGLIMASQLHPVRAFLGRFRLRFPGESRPPLK